MVAAVFSETRDFEFAFQRTQKPRSYKVEMMGVPKWKPFLSESGKVLVGMGQARVGGTVIFVSIPQLEAPASNGGRALL